MWSLFLFIFLLCLLYNYIDGGGNFVFFSRVVEVANSFREPTPRQIRSTGLGLVHEFKFGKRLYGILIPKKAPLKWTTAAGHKDDRWEDITGEMEYWAGPYKNFYGIPIKPCDVSDEYDKIAFAFPNGTVVHVMKKEVIILVLRQALGD